MMLELRNICKTYNQGKLDVPVLKDISLSVEQGEYVAIMGPSGSGKTTLMNIIGCLDSPTSGEYFLEGKDIAQNSDSKMSDVRLRSIGFVFQSFYLLSRQSALENVALPLLYAGVRRKERLEIARKALERVGLGDRVSFKPTQLSGGQCQRVAIARAIVNNPKVLLADEPTGALDTKSGEQIMEIFQKLNEEGVTIVMITHEPEIAAHAQRVLHIRDGQLLEAQVPKEEGPTLPADMIAPEDFHVGKNKKAEQAAPQESPAVQPVPTESKTPSPQKAAPSPQKAEQPSVERALPQRERSKGPCHAAGKNAPAFRSKTGGKSTGSQRPRHGAWISPAPAPAAPAAPAVERRQPVKPATLDKTAGTVLYEELTALLEDQEPYQTTSVERSPVEAAPKAERTTRPMPQHAKRSAPTKENRPATRLGGFGAPIPTDLGSLFPRNKRERTEESDTLLIPRTEF